MKKILVLILLIFATTGCVNLNNSNIDDIITEVLSSKRTIYNHNNNGFKYYLPTVLQSIKKDEYNEVLKGKNCEYYLYVDLVKYYNKVSEVPKIKEDAYYSKVLENGDTTGSINIVEYNNSYLVTVNYNYATVQVKVEEKDINIAVSNALIITTSIKYNDDIVKKLLENNEFSSSDEIVDIFENRVEDNNSLGVVDQNTGDSQDKFRDPDFIN